MMFECKFKINKMKHKFKIMQISIVTWAFYTLQRSAMSHESQVARFESHFCLLLFWTSHLTPLYISVDILKNWQCYLENYKYSRCFHWNYSNRYGKCKFESHFYMICGKIDEDEKREGNHFLTNFGNKFQMSYNIFKIQWKRFWFSFKIYFILYLIALCVQIR